MGEISAINSGLQKLKSIIAQQRLREDIEYVGDAATRYGKSIQKSVDFYVRTTIYHPTTSIIYRFNQS